MAFLFIICNKRFLTLHTLEILFTSVNFSMNLQSTLFHKRFEADIAFKRSLSSMQLFVLVVRVRGAIWRDVRAQVLVLALAAVGAFFLFRGAGNQLLMLMSYLVVAFAGLVLAVQPRPDESAGDR